MIRVDFLPNLPPNSSCTAAAALSRGVRTLKEHFVPPRTFSTSKVYCFVRLSYALANKKLGGVAPSFSGS